jgi:hypothetical protein
MGALQSAYKLGSFGNHDRDIPKSPLSGQLGRLRQALYLKQAAFFCRPNHLRKGNSSTRDKQRVATLSINWGTP